jgi:hypothetical protein
VALPRGAPDLGVPLQHVERLDDLPDPLRCVRDFVAGQGIQDPVEIVAHLGRKFEPCHA